jgi:glycosyltransferase involved in cell wall biosynthesis
VFRTFRGAGFEIVWIETERVVRSLTVGVLYDVQGTALLTNTNWPQISVVTPSLNQATFIEETIRSVLDQNYPSLDYIIIDGNSTDGTQTILRKYGTRLRWLSEKDLGQSDAINKGIQMARGEILSYLNADDLYLPETLWQAGRFFSNNPIVDWLYGNCRLIDEAGKTIGKLQAPRFNLNRMVMGAEYIPQPTVFWRRRAAEMAGKMDVRLQYAMDYDFFIRLGKRNPGHHLNSELACFRFQPSSKTILEEEKHWREVLMVSERYGLKPWTFWYWWRRARHRGLRALPEPLRRVVLYCLRRPQDIYQSRRKRNLSM